MQTIYFFITFVYGTEDTTSGHETTQEFTRLGYKMVQWVPSWTVPCGPSHVDRPMWTVPCGPSHVLNI